MVLEELQEVAELGGCCVLFRYIKPVVMAFNVVVHGGARGGGSVSVRIPRCFNRVGGHAVVRALLPVAWGHHARNNAVRVKLAEVAVVPRGDGGVWRAGVGVNGVLVLHRFKRDATVALVPILWCQVGHWLLCTCKFFLQFNQFFSE